MQVERTKKNLATVFKEFDLNIVFEIYLTLPNFLNLTR